MLWGWYLINDSRFSNPYAGKINKEALKKEIIAKLQKIKGVDGAKLIRKAYDGTVCFPRKPGIITPDIIFELADGYTSDFTGYSESVLFVEPEVNRRGEHSELGIFGMVAYNNKINVSKAGKSDLGLNSLNPTIMRYFGVRPEKAENSLI